MKSYKVKVSHLSSKIDEKDLQDNFEKIGKIVEVELKHKKAIIVSILLGWLGANCQKYETAEEAYRAVQKFDGLFK